MNFYVNTYELHYVKLFKINICILCYHCKRIGNNQVAPEHKTLNTSAIKCIRIKYIVPINIVLQNITIIL